MLGEEAEKESRIRGVLKRPWKDVPSAEEEPLRAAAQGFKTMHAEQLSSMDLKAAEEAAASEEAGEKAAGEGEAEEKA